MDYKRTSIPRAKFYAENESNLFRAARSGKGNAESFVKKLEIKEKWKEMFGFNRITFNPHIMEGHACIRGMRIPISLIVNLIAHGKQVDEILKEYPDLEAEDIQQALEYASWLACEQVYTRGLEMVK